MLKYHAAPATETHLEVIANQLADDDAHELRAQHWPTSLEAIQVSARRSVDPLVWLTPTGEPLYVCGVVPVLLLPPAGVPWMLATRQLPQHARPFLRESVRWLREQQDRYELLFNYVGAWHTRSIRWLDWLGFTVYPAQSVKGMDEMWYRIEWVRR